MRQHHHHNGHKSEQTPEDSEGQRSLAYCSPRGHKESDMTVTEQQQQQQILSSSSWGLGDGWQARKQETIYCCHYLTHQNPCGSAMNLSKKQKQTHRRRNRFVVAKGEDI